MAHQLKYGVILGIIILSGLILAAWTQPWLLFSIAADNARQNLVATGETAAPALTAFGLANIALAAALTISGPIFRVVLGILQIMIATCVLLSSLLVLIDPSAAGASAITTVTGVAGSQSVHALVVSVEVLGWPIVAMVAAVLLVVLGLTAIITSAWWPHSSRRYQAVRMVPATEQKNNGHGHHTSVDDWDNLTRGADPT
jgi:hypothetical protein